MSLDLFTHNRHAYEQAAAMLDRTGKASIVHPTGTGKSFIAFKLIEDHPNESILWLSPSEVIYKTQCENLHHVEPSLSLENVRFFTYAKLMMLTAEEITALADTHPAYIILDEFHRCGAACWGQGVERLLRACKDAKLLGLSATSIRYLDNQRDMADELFDGNIASEMTLGEAIVRGILPCPEYISVLYHYEEELELYQKRVDVQKDGLRGESQAYLDALRRAIDKAEGLEDIFANHMSEPHGKYIVFCSGFEHMKEMASHAKEWFAQVDSEPRLYTVFSSDPETDKAFAAFKADNSDHLKLLFCVDMLNEGVHVKGISGVILFRPTVSPIIYKQQIGRALTAGDAHIPVIFDCVCNADGLCSIDGLQREMDAAVHRLYANGEQEQVIAERFKVTEQVQDCRLLFEQLENSLSGGWHQYYMAASLYAAEHGNLEVPRKYRTPGGLNLGRWILLQAQIRDGRQPGTLTERQIEQLDSIGMVWGNKNDVRWERNFREAERYYRQNGDLNVPCNYRSADGIALGQWIVNQRAYRNDPKRQHILTDERIQRLDAIGMVWNTEDARWDTCYEAARRYYEENGNLLIPRKYVTEDGIKLGLWISNLRNNYRKDSTNYLTPKRIKALNAIGMLWENHHDVQWEKGYQAACEYYREHRDLEVPKDYVTNDGLKLGAWIRYQRECYRIPQGQQGALSAERKLLLDRLGMRWTARTNWTHLYGLAEEYLKENHTNTIPMDYQTQDGIWLGAWLRRQRMLAYPDKMGNPAVNGYRPLSNVQAEMVRRLGSAS